VIGTALNSQMTGVGPMKRQVGLAFWVESGLTLLSASLAILTSVWPDWVEAVFGFDPDQGNGSFEWELTILCWIATIVLAVLTRWQWRKAPATAR
jgi:hypothetical protein